MDIQARSARIWRPRLRTEYSTELVAVSLVQAGQGVISAKQVEFITARLRSVTLLMEMVVAGHDVTPDRSLVSVAGIHTLLGVCNCKPWQWEVL